MCIFERENRGCGLAVLVDHIKGKVKVVKDEPLDLALTDLDASDFILLRMLSGGDGAQQDIIIRTLINANVPTGSDHHDCLVLMGKRSKCDSEKVSL